MVGVNLFAYCFNNPVNHSDKNGESPDTYAGWVGEQIGKLIYDWLVGNGFENATGTFTVGLSGAVNGGPGVTASVGLAFDAKGNIALVASPGGGGGFPYVGAGGFASITNAEDVYKLRGISVATGGSANVLGYSLGGEYLTFKDS